MFRRFQLSGILEEKEVALRTTPMIDLVFLMLAFFMISVNLKHESELVIKLPDNTAEQFKMQNKFDQYKITLLPNGAVFFNGAEIASYNDKDLSKFKKLLENLKTSNPNKSFSIQIDPDRDAKHQRIIDVLDACLQTEIYAISFK